MGRISKSRALELARKLTENNRSKLELLEKLTNEQMTEIADNAMGKELKKAFQVFNDYMNKNSLVAFTSEEDSFSFYLNKEYPSKKKYGACVIKLDKNVFIKAKSLADKLEKERTGFNELLQELSATIYDLVSHKRIIATFPSLEKELETSKPNLPSNIESLKNRIIYG